MNCTTTTNNVSLCSHLLISSRRVQYRAGVCRKLKSHIIAHHHVDEDLCGCGVDWGMDHGYECGDGVLKVAMDKVVDVGVGWTRTWRWTLGAGMLDLDVDEDAM